MKSIGFLRFYLMAGLLVLGTLSCKTQERVSKRTSKDAYYQGAGYFVLRDDDQALRELETALALDPGNAEAQRLLLSVLKEQTETLIEQKKWAEALPKLERLSAFLPKDGDIRELLLRVRSTQTEADPVVVVPQTWRHPEPVPVAPPPPPPVPAVVEAKPPILKEETQERPYAPVSEEASSSVSVPAPASVSAPAPVSRVVSVPEPDPEAKPLTVEPSKRPLPKFQNHPLSTGRYLVQDGETLESIALELFGDEGRWTDIYWQNQTQIHRGIVFPGQVLDIPWTDSGLKRS